MNPPSYDTEKVPMGPPVQVPLGPPSGPTIQPPIVYNIPLGVQQLPQVFPMNTVKPTQKEAPVHPETPDYLAFPGHVSVNFDDVFRDPPTYDELAKSRCLDACRKAVGATYTYTQLGIYMALYFLVGWTLAFAWGLLMGVFNFLVVWLIQPAFTILLTTIRLCAIPVRAAVRAFVDPVFESIGQMFRYMKGRFNLDVSGLPSYSKHAAIE